jgi:hypothetical protein
LLIADCSTTQRIVILRLALSIGNSPPLLT